jgi:glutathione S-transferase
MKLYYAPGTCSLSPHIVAREAGLAIELERVDIGKTPHRTTSGADFSTINRKGYVPALVLDDGEVLTEGAAIVQLLADLAPQSGLAPAAGTIARYRLQEWLTFISAELHKMFSPWLFHPEHGEIAAAAARAKLAERFAFLDAHLARHPYLMGESFTAADAYAFAIVGWAKPARVDLAPFANLRGYMERIAARPRVQEALRAEELLRAVA